jgi:aminomethyltransferase
MPIPSPFHERTAPLCTSYRWKDWSGFAAVCSFDVSHEREYFAFRESAGMLDISPLFKYEVHGPDAARVLSRMMARDVSKLKVGRVGYSCWCDDAGRVIDDGTVARLAEDHYRVTAADPTLHWIENCARGFRVTIEDSSFRLAALALQGPRSREILRALVGDSIDALKFFGVTSAEIDGLDVWISRTGYTGDLGFEIWMDRDHALPVWDAVMAAGRGHGILPAGLDAMDVTRVEAGFILNGIDYYSSLRCLIPSRTSSPFELGLDWMVDTQREPFIGRDALMHEAVTGPPRRFVGLEVDWDEYETLFRAHGLPPEVHPGGWRDARPVYDTRGSFIGQATSGAWSPLLKKNLALATLRAEHAIPGTQVRFEVTVEYERRTAKATVVDTPFFNPERKRR